jgi:hypothetical protein
MTAPTKHLFEVTTALGHKERIRAGRFEIADQIVVFDGKKGGKGGVAAFPVNQLDSIVRSDITSPSGPATSSKAARRKAKSTRKTTAKAVTRHAASSLNGKSAANASKSRAKGGARSRPAR